MKNLIKKVLTKLSPMVVMLSLMAFVFVYLFSSYVGDLHGYAEAANTDYIMLRAENEALANDNAKLRRIHQLAVEFKMDPTIVMVVLDLAHKYVDPSKTAYRMIQEDWLTYAMLSLIKVESRGRPGAIGDKGKAFGLTQMWLSTAQQDSPEITKEDLLTVQGNLKAAFKYTHSLLTKYEGNPALWLYGWNRGETKVDKLLSYGEPVENGYAKRVYEAAMFNNGRQNWEE